MLIYDLQGTQSHSVYCLVQKWYKFVGLKGLRESCYMLPIRCNNEFGLEVPVYVLTFSLCGLLQCFVQRVSIRAIHEGFLKLTTLVSV
jgi:hypothetical protein